MSVPKSKRDTSKMEFFHNALELRKYLTFRILKDFGIKAKLRDRAFLLETSRLNEDEKGELNELLDKCDSVVILDEYPKWFIEHERVVLLNILKNLITNIVHANTIYITNQTEADTRRSYQTAAIANCHNLIQELAFLIDVIPAIEANKLNKFIGMTQREISLLKGWRKSDNKRWVQSIQTHYSVNSATNFCNANNNGNANNNNASNTNGVRPISQLPQSNKDCNNAEERGLLSK